ncbi:MULTISPECIES: hypothetical protein [Nocardia]|uniref:hypothetical protein n=1 Tax=Nocardia TaxID=1817 RepID=UPI000D688044|nr:MULTISPECIES: hypothetical protein [Nocardia]
MSVPLDQSVVDLLRQSAIGPMLDRPVNDVLKEMGLPALPEIPGLPPMPDLPPLPVIDLSVLAKPLTDLAGSFGTGTLPAAGQAAAGPPVDPAQVMQIVSTVLQTATTLGSSALQLAMTLWQSAASAEAAEKGGAAAKDTAAVADQSAQTSVGVATAASSVFQGSSQMTAIITKFMASVTAAAPFLATPPGQAFLVALTTETISEALAVIAKTRGELTVHSAAMAETGTKVPVTQAPKNVDAMQAISQVMQILGPLTSLATTMPQQLMAVNTALNTPKSIASKGTEGLDPASTDDLGGFGDGGGSGVLGGGPIGFGAIGGGSARELASWSSARGAGPLGAAGASAPSAEATGATQAMTRGGAMSSPGMMPMGGAAGAAAARTGESTSEGLRGLLVTEQHGNEVVGDIEGASLPVVGAAERVSEPLDSDSPDKALTL